MNSTKDFTELAPAINAYARIKSCGTRTDWHEPPTYVIPPREPVNMELVRYLWPELEAAK